jgi:hypothetical protein
MLRHLHASHSVGASSTSPTSAPPTTVSIRDSRAASCSALSPAGQLWVHRLARIPSAISAARGGSCEAMLRSRSA